MGKLDASLEEILDGIDACNNARLINSTLILIYSGIDAIASLEKLPGEKPRDPFLRWVNAYLLPSKPLACTALELYGARCGLVHDMSADSDLSRKGSVRPVVYSFGGASPTVSQDASDVLNRGYIAMDLTDLIEALRIGIHAYWQDVSASPQRAAAVNQAFTGWLRAWSSEEFDSMVHQEKLNQLPNP